MAQSRKVAVVTGSNKGIGFAIVRGLCKSFDGDVFLTARDEARGQEAVKELNKEGAHPKFHQLDLDANDSIHRFGQFLSKEYGGLDILVNNAGIAYKMASTAPFTEQAEVTVKTNFWGTLEVCKTLFPLLRPHARVVNVSSQASTTALGRCSKALKGEIIGCQTMGDVERLMTQFVDSVKADTYKEKGWPQSAYGVSKIGVTAMTVVHQKEFDKDPGKDIVVNACCPGYVSTDMSSHKGKLTIDQGADTPLYLALLPANVTDPRGKFVYQRKVLTWG